VSLVCPRCAACGACGPVCGLIARFRILCARVDSTLVVAGAASGLALALADSLRLTGTAAGAGRGRAGATAATGSYRCAMLPSTALLAAQYCSTCCPVRRYLRLRCPRMSPAASIAAAAKNALLSDETDGEGHRGGEGPSTRPSMERKVPSGARRTGRSSKTTPPVGGMPP
jgi:hypothetical protein